ncbi:WD repeat, SAM and U-box domain-containing protein 1 isoform X2 [Thamnophis elegans]|uniref:WD repeat, SAM and U-box domain-containing protein 1 isoform X2 n=1 Tax=Thamnophis elegans TaxID=35005 RepID=UPI0013780A66|nr:WD repeat, SAM and U-box domain-containing protein 1 isoform X2 [Thamnophis elegans]
MVKLICTLADHKDDVNCCAFSSSYLATCSLDKTVRLYSLNDFDEVPYSPLKGHTYAVHCCCFSPSGHILASCSTDGNTILWTTQDGLKVAVLEHPCRNPLRICRFSPDSTYLVSGAADGSVNVWNVQTLKLYRSGSVKDGSLVACAFAPNGRFFVTGSSCGDLTFWDDKMKCLYNEKAHDLSVTCCDFSSRPHSDKQDADYFRMASSGQDGISKIWLVSSSDSTGFDLQYRCTLSGHTAPVLACAFSSNGQVLVTGSVDKTVMIFETSTGSNLHILTQHTRYVTTCAFAPDMPLFATGSMDKCVHIWQLEPEQLFTGSPLIRESKISVDNWTEEDVSVWLQTHNLQVLVEIFKRNNIDESLGLRSKVLRNIVELRNEMKSASLGIPDEFLCPITKELMKEPVIAADGYSYEKEAIENWIIKKRRSSPMTNLSLQRLVLTPNRTLKMAINRWLETHPEYNEKQAP